MRTLIILILISFSVVSYSQRRNSQAPVNTYDESIFRGFELRNLVPAKTAGRIADIAMDSNDKNTWYVAVSSGNVWKTVNRGTTWQPVFDRYG